MIISHLFPRPKIVFGSVRTKNRFFWPTKSGPKRVRTASRTAVGPDWQAVFWKQCSWCVWDPQTSSQKTWKKTRDVLTWHPKFVATFRKAECTLYIYIYIGTSLTLQHLHDSLPFKTCTFGVDGFFPNNFPGRFGGWVPCFLVHHGGP